MKNIMVPITIFIYIKRLDPLRRSSLIIEINFKTDDVIGLGLTSSKKYYEENVYLTMFNNPFCLINHPNKI
jgi:hypothetical protein